MSATDERSTQQQTNATDGHLVPDRSGSDEYAEVTTPGSPADSGVGTGDEHAGATGESGREPAAGPADAEAAAGGTGAAQAGALIPAQRATEYRDRWTQLKGQFVDEPRHAVLGIDGLVGDVLDELQEVFRNQRGDLERGLHDEGSSTEELRIAFGRYREFFDRLLSF